MSKTLSKLLQEAMDLNLPQNYMKRKQELEKAIVETQHKYKDITCRNDTRICTECLNELKKQQVIDERMHNQKLIDNIVRKLLWDSFQKKIVVDVDMMKDKRTGEVLSPEVDYTYYK